MLALFVVLYQIWAFGPQACAATTRKLVMPLIISPARCCSFAGVAFCYFFVFGKVFAFIQTLPKKHHRRSRHRSLPELRA